MLSCQCLGAADSCQWRPEECPGIPTALTVTAIVLHGNRSKAAEVSWVLASFLAYACSFQVLAGSDFLRGFVGPWGAARPWALHCIHRQGRTATAVRASFCPHPDLSRRSGQAWLSGTAPGKEKDKQFSPSCRHVAPQEQGRMLSSLQVVPNLPRLNEEITIKKT